jgi:hypothetical protein
MLRSISGSGIGQLEFIRMPSDVRAEIDRVNERIAELGRKIDIREMLGEMLAAAENEAADQFLLELEEMIGSARESLAELERLKASLEMLASELEESKWITGC